MRRNGTSPATMGSMSDAVPPDRTVFRTCPLCEATCGLQIEIEDGAVKRIRGDQRRRLLAGLHLPQGFDAQAAATRTRTGCASRSCGVVSTMPPALRSSTRSSGTEAYRCRCRKTRVLRAVREAHGNEAVGDLSRQPRGAHDARRGLRTPAHLPQGPWRSAAVRCSRRAPSTRCLSHVASGYLYGSGGSACPSPTSTAPICLVLHREPTPSPPTAASATAPGFPGRIEAVQRSAAAA